MISIYNRYPFLLYFLLIIGLSSCGIYSFTGASVPAEVKTISIATFPNHAELVNPDLAPEFTDGLRDRFQAQTTLDLINGYADWEIKGAIVDYYERPKAANAEGASLNELTIVVNVEFTDNFNEKNSWEQKFTRRMVFPGTSSLSDVEESLVEEINGQLINDIFNKIAVNW